MSAAFDARQGGSAKSEVLSRLLLTCRSSALTDCRSENCSGWGGEGARHGLGRCSGPTPLTSPYALARMPVVLYSCMSVRIRTRWTGGVEPTAGPINLTIGANMHNDEVDGEKSTPATATRTPRDDDPIATSLEGLVEGLHQLWPAATGMEQLANELQGLVYTARQRGDVRPDLVGIAVTIGKLDALNGLVRIGLVSIRTAIDDVAVVPQ